MTSSKILAIFYLLYGLLTGTKSHTLKSKKNHSFQLLCEAKIEEEDIPILKYESLNSGIQVVIAKIDSPLVSGQLTFATKAQDDDGLPHALEHLVFMGSETCPYNGLLNLLANRCFAEGVNAWTDIDHTAYTIETAGKEGFMTILPIYLDHLFFPSLTNSSFITEVHHITDEGEDAGVVYSEMQESENDQEDVTYNALLQILYPEPSGYRYEIGGKLANLRNGTSIAKIRKYHKAFYRPQNLHIFIAGNIEPEEVFAALENVEENVSSKMNSDEPFVKPWSNLPPPFIKTQVNDVFYPSDIEDTGVVQIGWRGPSQASKITESFSIEALVEYLIDSSSSPLEKAFVEVNEPLATEIDGYMFYLSETSFVLWFGGVPVDKIEHVQPLLEQTLKRLVNETSIDLKDMAVILEKLILEDKSDYENSPDDIISQDLTIDALYGRDCGTLNQTINRISWYRQLLREPVSYWVELVNLYLLSAPMAVVRGRPSVARATELAIEKWNRVSKRRQKLGKKGLERLKFEVDSLMSHNQETSLSLLLANFPVPSPSSITRLSFKTYSNIDNLSTHGIIQTDPSLLNMMEVPVKIQVDDVDSKFVQMTAILDTESLTPHQRLYLPLLLELVLISSVDDELEENGTRSQDGEGIFDSSSFGGLDLSCYGFIFGKYSENVGINFKLRQDKYDSGVAWLKRALFELPFDVETVMVRVKRLLNSIGDSKRNQRMLLDLMLNDILLKPETNINKANIYRQENFLGEVFNTLEKDPSKIMDDLNQVYRNVTSLDRITIHLAGNLRKLASLTNLTHPWTTFSPGGQHTSKRRLTVVSDSSMRLPFDPTPPTSAYITGSVSEESGYLEQIAFALDDFAHPKFPALLVAISYLAQTEGPLWTSIRGRGLAYNCLLALNIDKGIIVLILEEAAQLNEAYSEAVNLIESYINGSIAWDQSLLESAKGSLIFDIIHREADISGLIQQSIYNYYRQLPQNFSRAFIHNIEEVKLEDLQEVTLKYIKPLIEPRTSRAFVVCPYSEVRGIEEKLKIFGHRTEKIRRFEHSRFSRL